MQRHAQAYTAEDTGLDEVGVGFGAFCAFKGDLVFDFGEFELDEGVGGVAVCVEVCEDFEGFGFAAVVDEPTGGFGEPDWEGGRVVR